MKIRPVILCGGAGTRLWENKNHQQPKQFIDWSPYIMADGMTEYDTFLIDGECRGECLAWVAQYANKDARVYLDDYERGYYSWALSFFDVINVIEGFAHLAELKIK